MIPICPRGLRRVITTVCVSLLFAPVAHASGSSMPWE